MLEQVCRSAQASSPPRVEGGGAIEDPAAFEGIKSLLSSIQVPILADKSQ